MNGISTPVSPNAARVAELHRAILHHEAARSGRYAAVNIAWSSGAPHDYRLAATAIGEAARFLRHAGFRPFLLAGAYRGHQFMWGIRRGDHGDE